MPTKALFQMTAAELRSEHDRAGERGDQQRSNQVLSEVRFRLNQPAAAEDRHRCRESLGSCECFQA